MHFFIKRRLLYIHSVCKLCRTPCMNKRDLQDHSVSHNGAKLLKYSSLNSVPHDKPSFINARQYKNSANIKINL